MEKQQMFVRTGIAAISLALIVVALNLVVLTTGALGGITLTEALADEFRIRFMPIPPFSDECYENSMHMAPGCEAEFYGNNVRLPRTHIRINSLGFRGREYPHEKGDGVYRIFLLGDSFTFGEGVNDDEAFPSVIERLLSAQGDDSSFEVWNLGIPGGSTDSEYGRLLDYLPYSPDLIILQTLENDYIECETFRRLVNAALGIPDERTVTLPPDEMVALRLGWERLRDDYVSTLGLEEKCSCVRPYLERIVEIAGQRGIPLIVYDASSGTGSCFAMNTSGPVRYQPIDISRERRYLVSRRDSHPNKEGHRMMADELMPPLIDALNLSPALQKI